MTVHVNLIIQGTPEGVTVQPYGDLQAPTDAAFVARAMLRLAVPLFAAGRPVRLVGQAEAMGTDASDEFCDCKGDTPLCEIETKTLRCQACGKGLLA